MPLVARASAPGKVILMGEHAVVYGRPAVVAALALRARATARRRTGRGASIRLPDLGIEAEAGWEEIAAYAERARDAWRAYAEAPSRRAFERVRGDDPAHLVRIALGEMARDLEEREGGDPPGLELEVASEIPIGSGFGSSAAVTVAVLAAGFAAAGAEADGERLDRIALEVERRQHGLPSGVDHATVLSGGILAARRRGAGLEIEPIEADPEILDHLTIWDSGAPPEATGDVVAAVRALRERDPESFDERLDRMAADVDVFRRMLEGGPPSRVAERIRQFERCLEALGVVPEPVRARIESIESRGGAAKISGAGSLTGPGAGSLLVFHAPGAEDLEEALAGCRQLPAALGATGLVLEVDEEPA